jgi:hypothetical protein
VRSTREHGNEITSRIYTADLAAVRWVSDWGRCQVSLESRSREPSET